MQYTSTRGKSEQPVWVGDIQAVKALVAQMETLVDYVRDKRLKIANDEWQLRYDHFKRAHGSYLNGDELARAWKEEEADRYKRIETETALSMTIKYRRWERISTGTPEEILGEPIDESDVVSIDIELEGSNYPGRDGYALAASLSSSGASAAFKAPEPGFIDMAGTRIKDQFKLQRPWYWWFRAGWVAWIVATPAFVSTVILSTYLVLQGYSFFVILIPQVIIASFFIPLGVWLLRRIATPFELLKDGKKGRAAKKISLITAFSVWLLSTIVVPIWLGASSSPQN